jgi:hypothetical protein
MDDVDSSMAANREAVDALIAASERSGTSWAVAPAPGNQCGRDRAEHDVRQRAGNRIRQVHRAAHTPSLQADAVN